MKKLLLITLLSSGLVAAENDHSGMHGHSHEGHLHETMVDGKDLDVNPERFDAFVEGLSNVNIAIVSVKGMVCDFCARGISKTFLKDKDVKRIDVHLDNGTDPLFRTRPGSVIIKDNWKLHHYFEDGKIELYNIEEDISESTDLSKTNLKKTKELYHDLNKWREANNAPIPLEKNPDYNQKFVDSINFLIINQKITERINN